MAAYSVADAKANLPRLIDKAMEGEEVVITRHGKVVAEIRPRDVPVEKAALATHERLRALRKSRPSIGITSVELLNELYEDPKV